VRIKGELLEIPVEEIWEKLSEGDREEFLRWFPVLRGKTWRKEEIKEVTNE